jgi:hypothetical protein
MLRSAPVQFFSPRWWLTKLNVVFRPLSDDGSTFSL